ncbi:peptide-methionine (R)-S-oxide reductase MsrB [Rothia sp. P7208]|uniref:peptide-methionine (R)-S-oxide reductase MsrB n=1 Tax=Rothia sp. P7208 TaxID=3402660 RepID=UPI003ACC1460
MTGTTTQYRIREDIMNAEHPEVGKIVKDWKTVLRPEEYRILRQGGTEQPFSGEYWNHTGEGIYSCKACNTELFRSTEKFETHCGWPSFFSPLAEDRIRYIKDYSLGMVRVEVRCSACDSHLGHVFEGEGYNTPTDQRYCINSLCLSFTPTTTD